MVRLGREREFEEGSVSVDIDQLLLNEGLRDLLETAETSGTIRQSELSDVIDPLQLEKRRVGEIDIDRDAGAPVIDE